MDQAGARKHDTGLSNRLTDLNLAGEMRATGLMEREDGHAGIVQASGVPGTG